QRYNSRPVSQSGDLVDRLAAHRLVGAAPRSELVWLAEHGQLRRFEAGDPVWPKAEPMGGLFLLFTGRISVSLERGGARRKVMEWRGGDGTGVLAYSRAATAPRPPVGGEPAGALVLGRRQCHELIPESYDLAA